MPRPCKSSEEKCEVNNERQKRWIEKGGDGKSGNRWKQLQARTLQRAENGYNVSYSTLQKYELLGALADINKKRGRGKHIKPTLLDNLDSKNIALAAENVKQLEKQAVTAERLETKAKAIDAQPDEETTETTSTDWKDAPELHPEVKEVTYEGVRNFFYYVYHELSEERRAELRNKLPFVTEVNGREIKRPEGTRNYAKTGWKQNFQDNKFERNIKEALCFNGQTTSDLIPCLLEKKRMLVKDSLCIFLTALTKTQSRLWNTAT